MPNQLTIGHEVKIDGVNVYNGRRNYAVFRPAEEESGIVFITDSRQILADLRFAGNKRKCIELNDGDTRVVLVEHILSAVYALGIDNVEIELSDGVCPTVDNCASEYFDALRGERKEQRVPKKYWRYDGTETCVRSPNNGKPDQLTVSPTNGFVIGYLGYYPHRVIGKQTHVLTVNEEAYRREIAEARPPGFLGSEILKKIVLFLNRMGIHGVNERNYLLVMSKGSEKPGNLEEFGVRYEGAEFVRHKILDVIGTLALAGRQFKDTEFRFKMTGHHFDLYALKRLFDGGHFIESD